MPGSSSLEQGNQGRGEDGCGQRFPADRIPVRSAEQSMQCVATLGLMRDTGDSGLVTTLRIRFLDARASCRSSRPLRALWGRPWATGVVGLCVAIPILGVVMASPAHEISGSSLAHVIRQEGRSDCGPAALQMILAHHRVAATQAELRRLAGTDERGTSVLGLRRAASAKGLDAVASRRSTDELQNAVLPAIAFVNDDHFVVVRRVQAGRVVIDDPASGRVRLSLATFDVLWNGTVLTFEPRTTERSDSLRPDASERKGVS